MMDGPHAQRKETLSLLREIRDLLKAQHQPMDWWKANTSLGQGSTPKTRSTAARVERPRTEHE